MIVVIADDLTGANATGVMLVKSGLSTISLLGAQGAHPVALQGQCLTIATDSRAIDPSEAYARVQQAAQRFDAATIDLFSKRIDSTLRGNLGAEIDALLDYLGPQSLAFIVPAYPSAGRIFVGGTLLLDGVPLSRTSVAHDPKTPVTVSRLDTLLAAQSRFPFASLTLDEVEAGEGALIARIEQLIDAGSRLLIFDAVDQEDIERIAKAALAFKGRCVAVDPGPFTAALSRHLHPSDTASPAAPSADKASHKVLAAIGSVNAIAAAQVEQLLHVGRCHVVFLDPAPLLEEGEDRQREMEGAVASLIEASAQSTQCALVTKGIYEQHRVPFAPYCERLGVSAEALSHRINQAMAQVVERVLIAPCGFGGLFTSGGDITVAVCEQLGAYGIELLDEVVPLAGFGRLLGGKHEGLSLVSKGGMVGDATTTQTCLDFLSRRV